MKMTELEKFKYQLLAKMLYDEAVWGENHAPSWRELTSEEKDKFYQLAKKENDDN
jgi:hypothetical protein